MNGKGLLIELMLATNVVLVTNLQPDLGSAERQCGGCHEPNPAPAPKPLPAPAPSDGGTRPDGGTLLAEITNTLGDPLYTETSSIDMGSIILTIDGPIVTQGSYIANGTLAAVGNVSEQVTSVTTIKSNGGTYRKPRHYNNS